METQTALVWTNSTIELYPVAQIHLYLTLVVEPGYPERDNTLRLHDTFDDFGFLEFGMLVIHILNRLQHFSYCL